MARRGPEGRRRGDVDDRAAARPPHARGRSLSSPGQLPASGRSRPHRTRRWAGRTDHGCVDEDIQADVVAKAWCRRPRVPADDRPRRTGGHKPRRRKRRSRPRPCTDRRRRPGNVLERRVPPARGISPPIAPAPPVTTALPDISEATSSSDATNVSASPALVGSVREYACELPGAPRPFRRDPPSRAIEQILTVCRRRGLTAAKSGNTASVSSDASLFLPPARRCDDAYVTLRWTKR